MKLKKSPLLASVLATVALSSMPLPAAITALANADFETTPTGQDVPGWFDYTTLNGDLAQLTSANANIPTLAGGGLYWLNLVDSNAFGTVNRGVYQSFGTHDTGITAYQVNLTIGQRGDTFGFGNVLVSLYSGTDTGVHGTPITSLTGLALEDSTTILGADHFATTTTQGTKDLQFSLDASSVGVGETLWISFTAIRDNTDPSSEQALFDNISITAVPEPSAALLGALGMLALMRRRRA